MDEDAGGCAVGRRRAVPTMSLVLLLLFGLRRRYGTQ